jgi:hypothetical protein
MKPSGIALVTPVMLPPGRARLAIKPIPTGSETAVITTGIDDVARWTARSMGGDDDVQLQADKLRGQLWSALGVPLCVSPLDDHVPSLDPAQRAQPLGQRVGI